MKHGGSAERTGSRPDQPVLDVGAGSGPPDRKVVLFDYTTSRTQEVLLRLLGSYRGYVMIDDYAGYNALALQPGVERLACMMRARRKVVDAQKVQPVGMFHGADTMDSR